MNVEGDARDVRVTKLVTETVLEAVTVTERSVVTVKVDSAEIEGKEAEALRVLAAEIDAIEADAESEEHSETDGAADSVIRGILDVVDATVADMAAVVVASDGVVDTVELVVGDGDASTRVGDEESEIEDLEEAVNDKDSVKDVDRVLRDVEESDSVNEVDRVGREVEDFSGVKLVILVTDSDCDAVIDLSVVPDLLGVGQDEDVAETRRETGVVWDWVGDRKVVRDARLLLLIVTDAITDRDRRGEPLDDGEIEELDVILLLDDDEADRIERVADELGVEELVTLLVRVKEPLTLPVATLAVMLSVKEALVVVFPLLGLRRGENESNEVRETVGVLDTKGDFEEVGTKLIDRREVIDAPLERETDVEDEIVAVRVERIDAEELVEVVTLEVGFGDVDEEKETVDVDVSAAMVAVTERELPADLVASNPDALFSALAVGEMEEVTERVELYDGVGERLFLAVMDMTEKDACADDVPVIRVDRDPELLTVILKLTLVE